MKNITINNKLVPIILSLTALLMLSGCDTFRSTFGLDHYQADEFNVSDHPPLSMPPNYDLTPPAEGAAAVAAGNDASDNASKKKAEDVLLGKSSAKKGKDTPKQSEAEKNVIKEASKGEKVNPNIRKTIDEEAKNDDSDNPLGKIGSKIMANIKKTSNDPQPEVTEETTPADAGSTPTA